MLNEKLLANADDWRSINHDSQIQFCLSEITLEAYLLQFNFVIILFVTWAKH